MDIRFDGRVVIITGAGGGIGRQYAMDFSARGAKIVVNDLGTSVDGRGASGSGADRLVQEIQAAGGEAVANADDVSRYDGAQALVRAALAAFGRIDILINNAGITRSNLLADMSPEDFYAVLAVHLFGSFNCTRAVWTTLQRQGYGRVLMTTSQSGLYGMETHANYSSAKAALVGLGHALSIEGRPRGINVNVICPMAATRMNEEFLTPEMKARLHPSSASAMALWLCSEACGETGQIVEAGMGYFAKAQMMEGEGIVIDPADATPEYLRDHFRQIADMTAAAGFSSAADFSARVGARVFGPPKPAAINLECDSL